MAEKDNEQEAAEAALKTRLEAVKGAIPPDVLEALQDEILEEERQRWRDVRHSASYKEVVSGAWVRKKAPQSSVEDRRYVPGALRHWRKVHGLSIRDAQGRIGYSQRSCSWRHWEEGARCPSYETLLRIIAATGLGYWVDEEGNGEVDPDLRLDILRSAEAERRRRSREKRIPS